MNDRLKRRFAEIEDRMARLETAVERLESRLERSSATNVGVPRAGEPVSAEPASAAAGSSAAGSGRGEDPLPPRPAAAQLEPPRAQRRRASPIDWEQLIGARAIGWAAVVVLLFATAFFVKYAFENGWIGPLGRVAVGVLAGVSLVVAGAHYHGRRWRAFSQMLTAAGVSLLYLATYSAYGFYHLLPTLAASGFLAVLVIEAAWLALRYDALSIALMAIVGGLLTPLLMHSERDQYRQLFVYLLLLNGGVAALRALRPWPAIGTIAFLGAEAIYGLWSSENQHPEKRPWALGLQIGLAALVIASDWRLALRRPAWINREAPARLLLVAVLTFGICYDLVNNDYHEWMGAMAIAVALLFATMTQQLIAATGPAQRITGTAFALSAGFLALALPLQSSGSWNALGWAVEAGALAWFGLRVERRFLRALAAPLALLAVLWLLTDHRAPDFTPPFATAQVQPRHWLKALANVYTLTALGAVGAMLAAIAWSRGQIERLATDEKYVFGAAFIALLLLLGYFISGDLYDAFARADDDRLAEMILSACWSVYAALLLAAGFQAGARFIRWTGLAIFGATILKVFYYDMAGLNDLYRVGAFLLLAILLGLAAWGYQRFLPAPERPAAAKG